MIRLSGPDTLAIANSAWRGCDLMKVDSHTAHLGDILSSDGASLDNAVVTIFRGPNSYTGEDTAEFSVHGSKWIQREVVRRLIELGARAAEPGEFTRRAFVNGRFDLAQAEAVADLISSSSRTAHRLAMSQMNGTFSSKLNQLRDRLVELASLLELELDFSEEDVEFADRQKLRNIADDTLSLMERLASSYKAGRAFKEGVPVVIAGQPNVGKSTLLNALLDEDKAIVSDIPGTTRDIIEDTCEIDGILFRFYDTAGLRETGDVVEKIGIERAHEAISKASIILWIVDTDVSKENLVEQENNIKVQINAHQDSKNLIIYNKIDTGIKELKSLFNGLDTVYLSARTGEGVSELKCLLSKSVRQELDPETDIIVTNERHYSALTAGAESLRRARQALDEGLSADFIAQDIREAIHHLSLLTGQITTDTLLGNIFANFCVGK